MTVLFSTSGMFKTFKTFTVFVCVVIHRIGNQGSQVSQVFSRSPDTGNILIFRFGLELQTLRWVTRRHLQKWMLRCWGVAS